jgi:hypothetical protein
VAALEAFDDEHASREEVWTMLATLPPKQRAVLVLRYFEDLDDRRIAELIGSSAGAVRVHAHRGLAALRETLTQQALEAPDGTGIAQAVRLRAARRRRISAAGLAVVAVAALLGLVFWLLRLLATAPPTHPSPSPTQPSPTPDAVSLVPLSVPAPTFPYELTYGPPGAGQPYIIVMPDQRSLNYRGFVVYVDSQEPAPGLGAKTATAVNGLPATLEADENELFLWWQQDGRWLAVVSNLGPETPVGPPADGVLRIAEGMRPGTTTDSSPPEIAGVSVPAGYELHLWGGGVVCTRPMGSVPGTADLCVSVGPQASEYRHIRDFTIDGLPAFVASVDDPSSGAATDVLVVQRASSQFVEVDAPNALHLTTDDLVAIYRGTTFA